MSNIAHTLYIGVCIFQSIFYLSEKYIFFLPDYHFSHVCLVGCHVVVIFMSHHYPNKSSRQASTSLACPVDHHHNNMAITITIIISVLKIFSLSRFFVSRFLWLTAA